MIAELVKLNECEESSQHWTVIGWEEQIFRDQGQLENSSW